MNDFLTEFIKRSLKEDIVSMVQMHSGLVHNVFKIKTLSGNSYILKQKLDHYVELPELHPEYKRIVYEKDALDVMQQVGLGNYFPKILAYDSNLNAILIEDLSNRGLLMSKSNEFEMANCKQVVIALSNIHSKLAKITNPIHADSDKKVYNSNLKYRVVNHGGEFDSVRQAVATLKD